VSAPSVVSAVAIHPRPGAAVTGLAVRQVYRGALVVTAVSAGMSALVSGTYRSTVGDSLDAASFAALAANPAIRTLFGQPAALDDPGGFTVWRTGTVVAVLAGVWGLLAGTRVTRGEEDAGRWDLLLAGRLPVGAVVAGHLAVLVAGVVVAGGAVCAALLFTGTEPAGAVLHGAGMAVLGVFFVGVGGLAAQVFPTRAGASGAAMAVLGVGLLARMVGDGVAALSWLRWVSPFGLVELTRPYGQERWSPLMVLAVAAVAVTFAAPVAAARRDLRGGWLAPRVGRAPRLVLLGSVPGFAVRRSLRPLAGWSAGIGAYFLLIGLIAESMTDFLTDNSRFADLAAQAGFAGLGSVQGYVGTLFALLAVPLGVFAAVRVAAFAADETGRRLRLLYAQPLTRHAVAGAEAAAAAGGAVVLAVVAGAAAWVGTALVGAGLSLPDALAGTLNVLPVAALCLGAAVFALGVAPRAVALVGTLPAVGGFLWRVIADSVDAPDWAGRVSPFAHLATVPADPPDWPGTVVMLAVAAILAMVGLFGYRRRDLRLG
jgi:ABC-2 type transport system permease protein